MVIGQSAIDVTPTKRPKIGLVLEGGGALGFAHIGVLKWLEQHRIPVDYIAGTSMGGLIGGLYAAGHKTEDIEILARDMNWDKVMSGVAEFQDLTFRRKEDRVEYPNRLSFGLKGGLSLPGGLNSGHEIGLQLDRLFLPYFNLRSFDDLPIPFRCVSAEIVSGTQAIFSKGSLAMALRSTMSIPGVFSPVHDGGKIYSDGGALNNLPVDVAKDMGAEITIAVYLDQGPDDPKKFNSLVGAAARNIAIMIAANEIKSMQQADILLSANLKGFTSSDFGKSESIVPKGTEAAAKKAILLERFALNETDWNLHLASREAKRRTLVPSPQFVKVEGTNPNLTQGMERALTKHLNQSIEPLLLANDLNKIQGAGYFERVGYNIVEQDEMQGLAIRAVERSNAPPFLDLGINIDGTDTNDVRLGVSGRATFMDLGSYRSELRTEFYFGVANGMKTEYFHPFTKSSKWFVAPRLYTDSRNFEVYNNRQRVSQYRIGNSGLGADIGYSISQRAELRIGHAFDWQTGRLRIGLPIAPNGSNLRGISAIRFRYIGQDNSIIPRSGLSIQTDLRFISNRPNGGDSFSAATSKLAYFRPINTKGSIFLTGAGGSSFGAKGLGAESFALGGPLALSAFGRNELLGNQFYLMQGGYLQELMKLNPLLGEGLYFVGFYELGKVYSPFFPNTPKNPMDAGVTMVAKTVLGPVSVGGSVGGSWRGKWWFGVGRIF